MKTTNVALLAALTASAAFAQVTPRVTMPPSPAFEVASIKPVSAEQLQAAIRSGQRPRVGIIVDKNRVTITYQSLSDILSLAYEVVPVQIVGPDYIKTGRFDIVAKLPAGATEAQVPQMLQALLAERFGTVAHREKREAQIYALVVSKGGLKKMKPATEAELAPEPKEGDQTQSTPFGKMTIRQVDGKGMVGFMPGLGTLKVTAGASGGPHIELSNLTTARFAQMLMSDTGADRVVVDKTGLKGSYEASFDISTDQGPQVQSAGGGMAPTPQLNPTFLAVEQLGLKLEPQKDSVDMLVIDHIEKTPTDN